MSGYANGATSENTGGPYSGVGTGGTGAQGTTGAGNAPGKPPIARRNVYARTSVDIKPSFDDDGLSASPFHVRPKDSLAGPPPPTRNVKISAPRSHHGRKASVFDSAAEFVGAQDSLDKVREVSDVVEDRIDRIWRPLRPYLPILGRLLIVSTFFEDSIRIVTQHGEQNWYLQRHRGFKWGLSHLFLYANVLVMLVCSTLIVMKRYPIWAAVGLLCVVIAQGFGYGLIFDLNFFLRNVSVVGGLLMVVSEAASTSTKNVFAGLPTIDISEADRKKYFQLAGRVLLIFLFLGFIFNGDFTFTRMLVCLLALAACIFVAIGFKAKQSAFFLVLLLSIFNIFMNNFWTLHQHNPQRDFRKYDFFQTLSIVGGFLLLVNVGAGSFSIDGEKKRS